MHVDVCVHVFHMFVCVCIMFVCLCSSPPSSGDSDGLSWIGELHLLPQYHAPTLRKDLRLRRASVDEEEDLEHLLSHLEVPA